MLRNCLILMMLSNCVGHGISGELKDKGVNAKQTKIGKIKWYTDYDEAMKLAKKRGKPLWLHFGENPG